MLFFMPVKAQYYSPNLNFSMGNFTNWQTYTGSCLNGIDTISPSQPISGRHTIMNGAQLMQDDKLYDERCPDIKKVPDGFAYSAKLGNEVANAEMDAIEYILTVDSSNSFLMVHFAFVMQYDSNHTIENQARFSILIKDSMGNPVENLSCAEISLMASEDSINLSCNDSILSRDWTTVGYNLEHLMGKTIKIYIETRDCALGEHFCYAYVTAENQSATILFQYCPGQAVFRLRAPDGFKKYTWTRSSKPDWSWSGEGQNYQNLTATDMMNDEIFTCEVESLLGCSAILRAIIKVTSLDVKFLYGVKENENVDFESNNYQNWYDTCNRTATFVDLSTVINSKPSTFRTWKIHGLDVTSRDSLFTYTFPDPENDPVTYLVRLTASAENGCMDTSRALATHYITIYPSPRIQIAGVEQMCLGDTAYLKAIPVRHTFINHTWSWEDTNGLIQTLTGDSIAIYAPGIYMLASENNEGCFARDTFTVAKSKLMMDVKITDVNCYGESTGELAHGEITGGTGGFQWIKWNLGDTVVDGSATEATYSNLAAGIYSVEALDSRNCLLSDEFEIKQNDSLEISAISYPATNNLSNGRLKLNVMGGKSPYQYEIRKEDNTLVSSIDTAWNLAAGIYYFQVTDAVQCVTSDTISISYVLGISDINNTHSIVIYPNPVLDGKLRIKIPEFVIEEDEQIIITDMTGKTVQTSLFYSTETELNVSSLASGAYVIRIGKIRGKFIKQ
jgi:hypothetical protein